MHICFITSDYPSKRRPVFTFVKDLVDAIADQGVECSVIAPYSITKNKRFARFKEKSITSKSNVVTIYRPNYFSFSMIKILGISITGVFHARAVKLAFRQLPVKPDVIYCHFWETAIECFGTIRKYQIPIFVASGESVINVSNLDHKFDALSDYVSGVICVSTKNKDESISKGLSVENKCKIFPNAIDPSQFKILNKLECRQKLGFAESDFIVIFVGAFNERKGSKRVSDALKMMNDDNIKSIFIGKSVDGSDNIPNCPNILFCGKVDHSEIPVYLNSADVFVLPTLFEGCCNAVIEAMGCGLPIISSDLPFNYDVLNKTNSILVDPMNTNEIVDAIYLLKNNSKKREEISRSSLRTVQSLTLDQRASKILDFIRNNCGQ